VVRLKEIVEFLKSGGKLGEYNIEQDNLLALIEIFKVIFP